MTDNIEVLRGRLFRKKPVIIEAMLFDGTQATASAICRWANAGDQVAGHEEPTISYLTRDGDEVNAFDMVIWTLEGDMTASPGDWIIKGVKGEFYPCKPDIFAATYEEAALAAMGGQGLEAKARAMFEAQADRLAAPWDRQWEPTKRYWREKAAESTAPQQPEAQGELTEQQKADRDAVMYGTGFMLGGKHIPAQDVMVVQAPQQPEAQAVPVAWLYTLEYGGCVANTKVSKHQLRYPFGVCGSDYLARNDEGVSYVRETPLYTTPPAKVPEGDGGKTASTGPGYRRECKCVKRNSIF